MAVCCQAREEEEKANRMRIEMLEAELEGAKDGHRQELEQATADLRQTQEVGCTLEQTMGPAADCKCTFLRLSCDNRPKISSH